MKRFWSGLAEKTYNILSITDDTNERRKNENLSNCRRL